MMVMMAVPVPVTSEPVTVISSMVESSETFLMRTVPVPPLPMVSVNVRTRSVVVLTLVASSVGESVERVGAVVSMVSVSAVLAALSLLPASVWVAVML